MRSFDDLLHIAFFRNAQYFAADLFYESFAIPFPVPTENAGLSISTPPANWWQQVVFYKWPETHLEVVGFCNWIRYADCYLSGGMCVEKSFYRRLPREHWIKCRERGGVAEIMLETASRELTDCMAWFGYCGDKKAYRVGTRAGYQSTRHPYVIVKWPTHTAADSNETQKGELVDRIAAIGAF